MITQRYRRPRRTGRKDWEDKRPRDRFADEARRLLDVLDKRLEGPA